MNEIQSKPKESDIKINVAFEPYEVIYESQKDFIIEFDSKIDDVHIVTLNSNVLVCGVYFDNKLKCYYNVTIVPINMKKITDIVNYEGNIQNEKGETEALIHFTSTVNTQYLTEVVIISIIYKNPSICQKMPEDAFEFTLKYNTYSTQKINDFNIALYGENDIKINTTCHLISGSEKTLGCFTVDDITNPGYYYPKLEETIISGSYSGYYISPFSYENQKIYLSKYEYNPLLLPDTFNKTYANFYYSNSYDLEFYFQNEFKEQNEYPFVIVGTKSLSCRHNKFKLICEINKNDFSDTDQYDGQILNVCGMTESTLKVYIRNEKAIQLVSADFKNSSCWLLPKDSSFDVIAKNLNLVESEISINDKISLAIISNKQIASKIPVSCIITKSSFNCKTTSDSVDSGEYHLIIDELIELSTLSIYPFYSGEYTDGSPNHNEINKEETKFEHTFNFAGKPRLSFDIIYKEKFYNAMKVIEKSSGEELYCSTSSSNIQNCVISYSIFILDQEDPTRIKTYDVLVFDACGKVESTIKVNIYEEFIYINVTNITSLDIEDICSYIPLGSKFKIDATNLEKLTKTYYIYNTRFELDDSSSQIFVKVTCEVSTDKFICKTAEKFTQEGSYHFSLPSDYTSDVVTIKNFTLENKFYYTEHANEVDMLKTNFTYQFDYRFNKKPKISIIYENKVEIIPKVMEKKYRNKLQCEISELNEYEVICLFNENIVPVDETDKTKYVDREIEIYNVCNLVAHIMTISVRYSEYNIVHLKTVTLPKIASCYNAEQRLHFNFTSDDLHYIETTSYTNDILLKKEDEDVKSCSFMTYCTVNDKEFFCNFYKDPQNPPKNGKYEIYIEPNAKIGSYAIIEQRNFTERIVFNLNDTILDTENIISHIEYDYKNGVNSSFIIPYISEIKEIPGVYIKNPFNTYLSCEIEKDNPKNLRCYFNSKLMPANYDGTKKAYSIYINNACYENIYTINLEVTHTKGLIVITNEEFYDIEKCNQYKNNLKIGKLSYIIQDKNPLADTITLSNVMLRDDSYYDIMLTIDYSKEGFFELITNDNELRKTNEYKLFIESQEDDYYRIYRYQGKQGIFFSSKAYNEPIKEKYEYRFDLKINPFFNFSIKFKDEFIKDNLPIVKVKENSKTIICNIDNDNSKFLLCKANRNDFPEDTTNPKNDKKYTLSLYNVCGQDENLDITITVYSSEEKPDTDSKEKEESNNQDDKKKKVILIAIIISVVLIVIISVVICICCTIKKRRRGYDEKLMNKVNDIGEFE